MNGENGWVFLVIVVLVCGAIAGGVAGCWWVRYEAVEAGAAHWGCDTQSGVTRFVWDGKERDK